MFEVALLTLFVLTLNTSKMFTMVLFNVICILLAGIQAFLIVPLALLIGEQLACNIGLVLLSWFSGWAILAVINVDIVGAYLLKTNGWFGSFGLILLLNANVILLLIRQFKRLGQVEASNRS